MPHRFHIVDVFAEELYAGNTLAVVRDAADLDTPTMQRIAREFGFSETTFVTSPPEGASVSVRIFTPVEELPFAGHPTLGTAWTIREHLLRHRPAALTLALGVGPVPVAFEAGPGGRELAWLTAPPVTLGRTLDPDRVAPALGLESRDVARELPVQHLLAGVEFLHVPLVSEDAVRRATLDLAAFGPLAREGVADQAVSVRARLARRSARAHAVLRGRREGRPGDRQRHGLPRRLPARARRPR